MIDPIALDRTISRLNAHLRAHAGGVEVTSVVADRVQLRFTGMCCGCPFKALTWRATVKPAMLELDGVLNVDAPGVRISDEAEERLRVAFGD
jgi:Fe-S cluster biogenesis protein NfuA